MGMKKILGFSLIVISLLMAIFIMKDFFPEEKSENKQEAKEKPSNDEQTNEQKKNEKEIDESEGEILDIQNEKEGGTDQDNIQQMKCEIKNISEEVQAEIADMDMFEYQAKKYLYENGILDKNIYSLNVVTMKYNENIKTYLMGIEGENEYFYIKYDLKNCIYSSEIY